MVVPIRRRSISPSVMISSVPLLHKVVVLSQAGAVPMYPARTLQPEELQTGILLHSPRLDPPTPARRFLHLFAYR